ncbi:MAG TPA: hypothetical protein VK472_08595 [Allosphingosinicella sp.]|nr:hypothetical protein [Allosphingosinicella sp.]
MPRNRLFTHALLAAGMLLAAGPAAACLPPLPSDEPPPPPPTREQMIQGVFRTSTDIVSGRVLGTIRKDGRLRFLVERVHKGKLRPGAILAAWQGWGMDPPACPGMIQAPPLPRGTRGTIYFYDRPEINLIYDEDMERAYSLGLLPRPPKRSPR